VRSHGFGFGYYIASKTRKYHELAPSTGASSVLTEFDVARAPRIQKYQATLASTRPGSRGESADPVRDQPFAPFRDSQIIAYFSSKNDRGDSRRSGFLLQGSPRTLYFTRAIDWSLVQSCDTAQFKKFQGITEKQCQGNSLLLKPFVAFLLR
jgi:hypothetical protein